MQQMPPIDRSDLILEGEEEMSEIDLGDDPKGKEREGGEGQGEGGEGGSPLIDRNSLEI